MKITCIADLHGYYPDFPGGDLLIIAGDLTGRDTDEQQRDFIVWLAQIQRKAPYRKIVYIAGNHDNFFYDKKRHGALKSPPEWNVEYLCDSGIEFDGLKIWGSPWTPTFKGINPACTAFCAATDVIKPYFDAIPDGIDILVTHGPPYGVMDIVYDADGAKERCGSKALAQAVKRVKPRAHIFGHIHEGYGTHARDGTTYVNCSHVNQFYRPTNPHIGIEI